MGEPWMPERPADELLLMQCNARKQGGLFYNLFFLRVVHLSRDLGEAGRPYILALQSELPNGKSDFAKVASQIEVLDSNFAKVRENLAATFFISSSLSRQSHADWKS